MKKQGVYFSILKSLLIIVAILFSYGQPAFAQDDDSDNSNQVEETQDDDSDKSDDDSEESDSSDEAVAGDVDNGKSLFNSNCAACHKVDKESTGPALRGTLDKIPNKQWLYDWVHNSSELIKSGDAYAVKIYEEYNQTAMTHFPELSEQDIDDIFAYVEQPKAEKKADDSTQAASDTASSGGGVPTNVILGILALILLLLVVILVLVNKTLTRFAQEKGVEIFKEERPKQKPLWKLIVENQFIMICFSIVLMLVGSYWVYFYMMQIGVDQGYEPVQPIHYSHRIHAGDNKIDCKYCHSAARVSKTSGIPSLNTCMNCHEAIDEVAEETATEEHSKEFYDGEIAKLYDAVGWDPETRKYSGDPKPVKWVRVHNLPDFAYFNHAQHVSAGKIDCQKCHGEVEEMEVLRQDSKLTMGWCIECHRDTDVKMEGNKYYEKIHKQLSKKYGVEKLTVAEMGGLECGKCHY